MAVHMHRASPPLVVPPPPRLRLVETRRRERPHLLTYVVANAVTWALWAAISVSADPWYWWPIVPLVGWTLVLALHLRSVDRGREP